MFPDPHGITDVCIDTLAHHASELDSEHAVYGLDALKETQVHEILALGIAGARVGVHRESPYPGSGDPNAKRSARTRCDLVLTPDPHSSLVDPVERERALAQAQETLFSEALGAVLIQDPAACEPEDALWVEIKCVAQHACRDGVYVPNASYAHELTHGLCADVAKLASDEHIWHAASLLVVFTQHEETAEHDIASAVSIASSKGLPVRTPIVRTSPITDRGGNACVCVAYVPVAC